MNGNVYADSRYKIFRDLGLGDVRTYVDENGGIWFYMNDIARILGVANPRDITRRLGNSGLFAPVDTIDGGRIHSNQHGVSGAVQTVKETIVSEKALIYICATSRKPEAKNLLRFVSEEVVPNLARYGGFIMPEDRELYKQNPNLVKDLIQKNENLQAQVKSYDSYSREQDDNYNQLVRDYDRLLKDNEELQERINELEDELDY